MTLVPLWLGSLVARVIGGRPPVMHKAYPGTVGVCTAVAALLPGTVVAEATVRRDEEALSIGHPSGTVPVWARVGTGPEGVMVEQAAYARTARRLAEGFAFVRPSAWPE